MIHLHRGSGRKPPSIQISPMIDMVFLLLIFFIVCTMYMSQQKGVPVDLPESTGQLQQEMPIQVTLPRDGSIWFQDQQVTLPELVQKVGEAARKDPRQVVNLRADKEISYGRVMGVLGEMKKAGLQDFSLAVTTGESHGKP